MNYPVWTLGNTDVTSHLNVFKTNTIAPFVIVEALIEQVAKSSLKMLAFISSDMGNTTDNSIGGYYLYRSSKAALDSIVKSLAIDLKARGVTVVFVHPGRIAVSFWHIQEI